MNLKSNPGFHSNLFNVDTDTGVLREYVLSSNDWRPTVRPCPCAIRAIKLPQWSNLYSSPTADYKWKINSWIPESSHSGIWPQIIISIAHSRHYRQKHEKLHEKESSGDFIPHAMCEIVARPIVHGFLNKESHPPPSPNMHPTKQAPKHTLPPTNRLSWGSRNTSLVRKQGLWCHYATTINVITPESAWIMSQWSNLQHSLSRSVTEHGKRWADRDTKKHIVRIYQDSTSIVDKSVVDPVTDYLSIGLDILVRSNSFILIL